MKTVLAFLALWAPQEKLDWKKDHAAALQEARKDGKYLIIHFSGPN